MNFKIKENSKFWRNSVIVFFVLVLPIVFIKSLYFNFHINPAISDHIDLAKDTFISYFLAMIMFRYLSNENYIKDYTKELDRINKNIEKLRELNRDSKEHNQELDEHEKQKMIFNAKLNKCSNENPFINEFNIFLTGIYCILNVISVLLR